MGVSMKDIKLVSAMVIYVMTLDKHKRMMRPISEKQKKRLPLHLRVAFKHFSKRLRRQMHAYFAKDWNEDTVNNKFEELNLNFRNNMDDSSFPFVDFIKFCYQISELAAWSYSKGFEPASKLAEHYILEVIKSYRSKRKFSDQHWTLMNDVLRQNILDNDMY